MASASIGTAWIQIKPSMEGLGKDIASELETQVGGASKKVKTALDGIAKVGFGAIIGAAAAAGAAITLNIGGAIRRIDTLNNSTRTFQNIGFEAGQVAKSMEALENSILGLPTPLDSAVRGMTALAATYGDIDKGQKVFTALNNAILGFGGSAAMVDNAIIQLSQLPMDGPLDAQTWNSLRNSGLTPVLVAIARDMGLGVNEMKKKFGEGELSVRDFTNALIRMDTEGAGGMKSLQEIAQDATAGISTGFANMNTAIQRGIASVIKAIGSERIAKAMADIGKTFERGLKATIPFFQFVERNSDIFLPIILAVTTFVALVTAYVAVVKTATAIQKIYNSVLAANPWVLLATAVIAVTAALTYFFTQTETGRQLMETITNTFSRGWEAVKNAVETVSSAVETFVGGALQKLEDAGNKVIKFLEDWRYWFINIGIVIGTFLIPTLLKMGVQFTVTAAKAIANAAAVSAAWVASSAKALAGFIIGLPAMVAQFAVASAQAVVHAAAVSAAWVASSARTVASWAVAFATYLTQVAVMVAQTVAAGVRMAAAWLMAMGPIGLIVAAVAGATALIIANWDTVKGWLETFWNWIKDNWDIILGVLTGGIGIAVVAIIRNFDKIKSTVGNVWNWIKGVFGTIGEVAATIIKAPVNAIIGFAEKTINGFIRAINGAIGAINKIPGVNIGTLGEINIPKLAAGGVVTSPTLALIGEGRESEAVIPLSKLDSMLNGDRSNKINQEVNIQTVVLGDQGAVREFFKQLNQDTLSVAMGMTPGQGMMP